MSCYQIILGNLVSGIYDDGYDANCRALRICRSGTVQLSNFEGQICVHVERPCKDGDWVWH